MIGLLAFLYALVGICGGVGGVMVFRWGVREGRRERSGMDARKIALADAVLREAKRGPVDEGDVVHVDVAVQRLES